VHHVGILYDQKMQTLGKTCRYKASTVQLYSSKMMPAS